MLKPWSALSRRLDALIPVGSLARRLVLHLLPAVVLLVLIDLLATWLMTRHAGLQIWLLRDIFWSMVVSQVLQVSLFVWVLVSTVRSALTTINRLSTEIRQRSIDDMQPLKVEGLPTEVTPVVTHFNDLLVRLGSSMQAQKRFIGHAAHQLRTPLAGLKIESELMLARPLPDDIRVRAERIKSVIDRMIRLGQQLLVLARADSATLPRDNFVRLDLCEWVRINGAEWIPASRARHIQVHLAASDDPVWIDANPLLLEELLGNLMDNALRYGVGATNIRLQVGANPPSLAVEDDGPGIDLADSERIFEAFYRSPNASAGGSGLGLAIVREIAQAHGAWWSLASRPAFPGTRISVVFPGPRIGARLTRQE